MGQNQSFSRSGQDLLRKYSPEFFDPHNFSNYKDFVTSCAEFRETLYNQRLTAAKLHVHREECNIYEKEISEQKNAMISHNDELDNLCKKIDDAKGVLKKTLLLFKGKLDINVKSYDFLNETALIIDTGSALHRVSLDDFAITKFECEYNKKKSKISVSIHCKNASIFSEKNNSSTEQTILSSMKTQEYPDINFFDNYKCFHYINPNMTIALNIKDKLEIYRGVSDRHTVVRTCKNVFILNEELVLFIDSNDIFLYNLKSNTYGEQVSIKDELVSCTYSPQSNTLYILFNGKDENIYDYSYIVVYNVDVLKLNQVGLFNYGKTKIISKLEVMYKSNVNRSDILAIIEKQEYYNVLLLQRVNPDDFSDIKFVRETRGFDNLRFGYDYLILEASKEVYVFNVNFDA